MPARDQSGPQGEGPMSGRGMGNCTGSPQSWLPGQGMGLGRWHAYGRGRGYRNRFFARPYPGRMNTYPAASGSMQVPDPKEEEQVLKGQASWLKSQLDLINKRIATISDEQSDQD